MNWVVASLYSGRTVTSSPVVRKVPCSVILVRLLYFDYTVILSTNMEQIPCFFTVDSGFDIKWQGQRILNQVIHMSDVGSLDVSCRGLLLWWQ